MEAVSMLCAVIVVWFIALFSCYFLLVVHTEWNIILCAVLAFILSLFFPVTWIAVIGVLLELSRK